MADSTSISGPVDIRSDSKERVAYDLSLIIARNDSSSPKDRAYWLKLYAQCNLVVNGDVRIDDILKMY